MRFISDTIIYIFDLTESYPLKNQEKLFKKISDDFDKPMIIYLSKTDILEKTEEGRKAIEEFKKKHKDDKVIDNKDKLINELVKRKKELF
jgi:GTP1/Obg family GTP-binding protein